MNANAIYREVAYALRAGKSRELLYSVFLECRYWWCYVLRIHSRLMDLKPFPGWRYCSARPLDVHEFAASLRVCKFSLVECRTGWSLIAERADGAVFGTTHDLQHVLRRADSFSSSPRELFRFKRPIVSVFISVKNLIFVATNGRVYRSQNGGSHFDEVLQLSDRDSTVWHNHGIDETPEGLVIGEYGNVVDTSGSWNFWKSLAFLYLTQDDGESWRCIDLVRNGGSKHIHLARYSRRLSRLLITVGDRRKYSYWVDPSGDLTRCNWNKARFDSFALGGGHTGFAETDEATLLGTDYRIAPNSIIKIRSAFESCAMMLPRPYRHSPVINMFSMRSRARWITFANLCGGLSHGTKNALIYSDDGGDSWSRLIEYDSSIELSIANSHSHSGPSGALVFSTNNAKLGEQRTFIISAVEQR